MSYAYNKRRKAIKRGKPDYRGAYTLELGQDIRDYELINGVYRLITTKCKKKAAR